MAFSRHLCLFLVIALPGAIASATDIYIIAGQSNAWRLGSLAGIPGEESGSILYFGMACSSRPEKAQLTIIKKLHPSISGAGLAGTLRAKARKDIVFIQYGVCGSSLNDTANWYPGDNPAAAITNDEGLYQSFTRYLADIRLQLEAEGIQWKVDGLFWHQGEADTGHDLTTYEQNLRNLFWRFRNDLGENLPIIAGHIRDLDAASRQLNLAIDAVADTDPLFAVVPLDGLPFESPTDVHVKPAGCIVLGERLAEAFMKLQRHP
ncbi:MAG: sialate O-acetylesterase [Verrucomicrobiales bacterium]|nr:sialate O-acetylesterase [Verrucomicrobiales bacterium]